MREAFISEKPMVLEMAWALHDPAAWLEDGAPLSSTQSEAKTAIGDRFAAEVAVAAKAAQHPGTEGRNLEAAWRVALDKANADYARFFGSDAANRAGMNAALKALGK